MSTIKRTTRMEWNKKKKIAFHCECTYLNRTNSVISMNRIWIHRFIALKTKQNYPLEIWIRKSRVMTCNWMSNVGEHLAFSTEFPSNVIFYVQLNKLYLFSVNLCFFFVFRWVKCIHLYTFMQSIRLFQSSLILPILVEIMRSGYMRFYAICIRIMMQEISVYWQNSSWISGACECDALL